MATEIKKKSAYQKLKERNMALMTDIRILVHKDTPELTRMETKLRYRMLFDVEDMIWK